jgi:serine/threonine protein kinase
MSLLIGQILLSQFRVDALVAYGDIGAIYRVWDLKRNVPLAMKMLHSEMAEDLTVFTRFEREANALKKLAHPNIVPFYGLYQTFDFAFLLERFIDGPSMKDILHQRHGKPLPVSEALAYLKALCAALGYAHANGVVHCDVKPGNVLVDTGGHIYLTDFGIARHAESTTATFGPAGTPAYMAPEQISGEAVSSATDVYALGIVLFEMLTGQRPFRGTEAGTEKVGVTAKERILYGQLHLMPTDPCSLNPEIPAGLRDVILKVLSKRPEARFASTQALFAAARATARASPASFAERLAVQDTQAQQDTISRQTGKPSSTTPAVDGHPVSHTWLAWGVAGALLVGVLFLALWRGEIFTKILGNRAAVYPNATTQFPLEATSTSPMDGKVTVSLLQTDTPSQDSISAVFQPTFLTQSQTLIAIQTQSAKYFDKLSVEQYPDEDYLKVPYHFTFTITIDSSEILLWSWNWCAIDQATLYENRSKMGIQFTLNGQEVSLNRFLQRYFDFDGKKCLGYTLGVKDWVAGQYRAVTTMTFKGPLNDGTYEFQAGQQMFEYNIDLKK